MLRRDSYPSPLGVTLALLLEMEGDLPDEFNIHVAFRKFGSGEEIASPVEMQVVSDPSFEKTNSSPSSFPVIVGLSDVAVPEEGQYQIEISVDGTMVGSLRYDAVVL